MQSRSIESTHLHGGRSRGRSQADHTTEELSEHSPGETSFYTVDINHTISLTKPRTQAAVARNLEHKILLI